MSVHAEVSCSRDIKEAVDWLATASGRATRSEVRRYMVTALLQSGGLGGWREARSSSERKFKVAFQIQNIWNFDCDISFLVLCGGY